MARLEGFEPPTNRIGNRVQKALRSSLSNDLQTSLLLGITLDAGGETVTMNYAAAL